MADTYSQIYIQSVFAVKGRQNFISPKWSEELYKYISGTINGKGAKSLAVNGWRDHIHIFFGIEPAMAISDIVGAVKACSSGWINESGFLRGKFNWQSGFGAFSYSKSQRDSVIKYIMGQENHHQKKTFREEYLKMLNDFEIEYKEQYLFEFYD